MFTHIQNAHYSLRIKSLAAIRRTDVLKMLRKVTHFLSDFQTFSQLFLYFFTESFAEKSGFRFAGPGEALPPEDRGKTG